MTEAELLIKTQELEMALKAKEEELATARESLDKSKQDNDNLRLHNQKLYAKQVVATVEEVDKKEKIETVTREDISTLWGRK